MKTGLHTLTSKAPWASTLRELNVSLDVMDEDSAKAMADGLSMLSGLRILHFNGGWEMWNLASSVSCSLLEKVLEPLKTGKCKNLERLVIHDPRASTKTDLGECISSVMRGGHLRQLQKIKWHPFWGSFQDRAGAIGRAILEGVCPNLATIESAWFTSYDLPLAINQGMCKQVAKLKIAINQVDVFHQVAISVSACTTCPNLRKLVLRNLGILDSPQEASMIGPIFVESLRKISLSVTIDRARSAMMRPPESRAILAALLASPCDKITHLQIDEMMIMNDSAYHLAEFVLRNRESLETLEITCVDFLQEAFATFVHHLSNVCGDQHFKIGSLVIEFSMYSATHGNHQDQDAANMIQLLSLLPDLTRLSLMGNYFGDKNTRAIIATLAQHQHRLTLLDLDKTGVGQESVDDLLAHLEQRTWPQLSTLEIFLDCEFHNRVAVCKRLEEEFGLDVGSFDPSVDGDSGSEEGNGIEDGEDD